MGSRYITEAASDLRQLGLHVIEIPGWQHRARSNGGYNGMPLCVMWHHTATPGTKVKGVVNNAIGKVGANIYLAPNGDVHLIAAGRSNTNGKGKSIEFSRGRVPAHKMNDHAWAIEIINDGIGEPYPAVQMDAAFTISNWLNRISGNRPDDVMTHFHYAPDRKIDPARGLDTCQGSFHPSEVTDNGTWDLEELRAECRRRAGRGPRGFGPQQGSTGSTEEEEVKMFDGFWRLEDQPTVFAVWKDGRKTWVSDDEHLSAMTDLMRVRGFDGDTLKVRKAPSGALFRAMGLVEGPQPDGLDAWGVAT